jgi:hypothetical protein
MLVKYPSHNNQYNFTSTVLHNHMQSPPGEQIKIKHIKTQETLKTLLF